MSVKIYSTPTCVYCKMAKEYFKANKVNYTEYDVAEDVGAREEMVNVSHQLGVPVIDIDGQVFVGFNRKEISKALGLKN